MSRSKHNAQIDLRDSTILLTLSGSRAYGLHTEQSDVDLKGVAIPPVACLLGAFSSFEQVDSATEMAVYRDKLTDEERAVAARTKLEGSVYDLRKFVRLAAEANPGALEALFCRDQEVRICTPLGECLREHRDLFLSARAKQTFSGYAAGQLKRIRTHRRWLLDPHKAKPTRAQFDLPETTLIPGQQLAALQAEIRRQIDSWAIDFGGLPASEKIRVSEHISQCLAERRIGADETWRAAARVIGLEENFIALMARERRYAAATQDWDAYRAWRTHRNPDRAALEAQHGYDTKHASHLYRLLKMCRELLDEGRLKVWRGDIDADEIQAIRAGRWSYDQLVEWAEAENRALDERYRQGAYRVPGEPELGALDELCINLVREFHQLAEKRETER
jgi:predicted nucleotidyltransferase